MTPLQKSIAEIEAMRDEFNPMCDEFTLLDKAAEAITANLEYEREVIEDAYDMGQYSGMGGGNGTSSNYYTKTYENK